jgi:hypothetical protein
MDSLCCQALQFSSIRLTQLAQNGWVFQSANVLRNFLAFGQAAQQAAHDFP